MPPQPTAALTLAALGVVYSDIGTSPLYAVKETFNPAHGIPLASATIVGGISAIFWSLMFVVSLKYVVLIMRASNKREGGVMALLALALSSVRSHPEWSWRIALLGLFGVALFYGDAGLEFEMMETSFFLSRETIISTPRGGMVQWREQLFAAMARNAGCAAAYFNLPTNRVIELGTQVEI